MVPNSFNYNNLKCNFVLSLVNGIISYFYLILCTFFFMFFQVSYNEIVTFIINQTPMSYKDILLLLSYINMML